jgi:hypothetical protein
VKLIAEYILACKEKKTPHQWKKTPYHWIQIQDMEATNPGVLALRAWGKKPNQVKSMAFKSRSQCSSYLEKWKQDKRIEKTEMLGEFEDIDVMIKSLEQSFPWLDMHEHAENLNEIVGFMTVFKNNAVVSKPQIPLQQLPETYGWW